MGARRLVEPYGQKEPVGWSASQPVSKFASWLAKPAVSGWRARWTNRTQQEPVGWSASQQICQLAGQTSRVWLASEVDKSNTAYVPRSAVPRPLEGIPSRGGRWGAEKPPTADHICMRFSARALDPWPLISARDETKTQNNRENVCALRSSHNFIQFSSNRPRFLHQQSPPMQKVSEQHFD